MILLANCFKEGGYLSCVLVVETAPGAVDPGVIPMTYTFPHFSQYFLSVTKKYVVKEIKKINQFFIWIAPRLVIDFGLVSFAMSSSLDNE